MARHLPARQCHADQFLAALASHHLAAVRADSDAAAPPPAAEPVEEPANEVEIVLKQAVERANAVIHRAAESK